MVKNMLNKAAIAAATFSIAMMPMFAAPALAQSGTVTTDELFGGDASAIADELGQSDADVRVVVSRVIRAFMGLLGLVAVIIILLGGFKWMTAGGEEEKVGEAKKLIISGVIGLVIILSAYGIANFVINAIVQGQQP